MLDFMRRQRSTLKWVWVILIFIFSITLVTLYIPFGDLPTVVLDPGDYDISWSFFQDGFSGTNVFFATEGYQRVSAVSVPELGSLLLLAVGLVCLAGARRLRRV